MGKEIDDIRLAGDRADILPFGPDLVMWGRAIADSSLLRKELNRLPKAESNYYGSLQVVRMAAVRIFGHVEVLLREHEAAEEREAFAITEAMQREEDRLNAPIPAAPLQMPTPPNPSIVETLARRHKQTRKAVQTPMTPIDDQIDARRLAIARNLASIIHTADGGKASTQLLLQRSKGPHPELNSEMLLDITTLLERKDLLTRHSLDKTYQLTKKGEQALLVKNAD